MILYEKQFKRQWFRGKLSRKMKKRVVKEIGFPAYPSKLEFGRDLGYRGLCAGYAGMKLAQDLAKAFNPMYQAIQQFGARLIACAPTLSRRVMPAVRR